MLIDRMLDDLMHQREKDKIQWLVDDGQYAEALKELRTGVRDLPSRLKEISILRRSSGTGDLSLASKFCEDLKREVDGASIPALRSRYSYEAGYVALLLGYPRLAVDHFRESLVMDDASGPSPEREGPWLGSAGMLTQSLVARDGRFANWQEIDDIFVQAHQIIARKNHGDRTRRQWVDNWNWTDVWRYVVRGERKRCLIALRLAQQYAYKNTLDTKHNRLGIAVRLSIEGTVAATFAETEADAKAALCTLAQGLVLQVGQRRRYPEMVRDVLFCAARVLPMTGEPGAKARASRIETVATRTRDGTAWLRPYVAPVQP